MVKAPHIGVVLVLALGLGLGYTGWRLLRSQPAETCDACGRKVHLSSRAIGRVDGRTETYCCLACALTQHRQSGKTVEVVELRDYPSGQAIPPGSAYIVRESDVNLCLHQQVLADPHKGTSAGVEFDRCSPSMLAFANRDRAEQFQKQHGGILLPFSQLGAAFQDP